MGPDAAWALPCSCRRASSRTSTTQEAGAAEYGDRSGRGTKSAAGRFAGEGRCHRTRKNKQNRVERLAGPLWAAHGFPEGCYGEFYFQASQEIALAEDLSKVNTAAVSWLACASRTGHLALPAKSERPA